MGLHDDLTAWLAAHDEVDAAVAAERDRLTEQLSAALIQQDADRALIASLRARIAELEAAVPPAPSTAFGTNVESSDRMAERDTTYGRLDAVRWFRRPGQGASWPFPATDRIVVSSFKDYLSDAAAEAFFLSAPDDGLWCYFHEPEDDIARGTFSAAEYRDRWRHLRAIQNRNRPDLRSCLILMAWSLTPKSGRDWRDYYPGDDVVDVLGWDAYNGGASKGTYASPADVFGRCVEVSRSVGKPFGFAEWGSLLVAGDGGTGRAAWMRQVGAYHREVSAEFSCYFDSSVGGDYRLTDEPSKQAMRDILAQTH